MLRVMFDGIVAGIARFAEVASALINIGGAIGAAIYNVVASFAAWANEASGLGSIISWLWDHTIGGAMDLIVWFSNLITATGGFGGALSALGQIAAEVWDRIGQGAVALGAYFDAAAGGMVAVFAGAFASVVERFAAMTSAIASGWNSLMGSLGIESNATGMGADLAAGIRGAADQMKANAANSFTIGSELMSDAARPLESVARINEQIAASAAAAGAGMAALGTGIASANDAAGGGGGGGKKGGGIKKLKEELTELQRATDEWSSTMKQAFTDFITKGGSFKDVLSQIIGKLAEMLANSAFDNLFKGAGGGGILGGILGAFGIGANANGTNNWRGGLSMVNERGGEIMNLPKGTQVIPHDISKRMADRAASAPQALSVSITMDESTGQLGAFVREQAGRVVAQARPEIVRASVSAASGASRSTKSAMGVR